MNYAPLQKQFCNKLTSKKRVDYQLLISLLLITINGLSQPVISDFSPKIAGAGTVVTIQGSGYLGTSPVVFFGNCRSSSVSVINDYIIEAVVPAGVAGKLCNGTITLQTSSGTVVVSGLQIVRALLPVIDTFTPAYACRYSRVIIKGKNFANTYSVKFGGVPAQSFTVINSQTINAIVGSGTSGTIEVKTPGGTVTSSRNFGVGSIGINYAYIPTNGGVMNVINTATNVVVATIPIARGALKTIVSPGNDFVYVLCLDTNGPVIEVIQTSTNTVTQSISVPSVTGFEMILSPDGRMLYGFEYSGNLCTVVDTKYYTIRKKIPMRGTTTATAAVFSPDGSKLYVLSNNSVSGNGVIKVISTGSYSVIGSQSFSGPVQTMCISPDGTKIYVSGNGAVYSINASLIGNLSPVPVAIPIAGSVTMNIDNIIFTPDGTRVCVAYSVTSPFPGIPQRGNIAVVNTTTNQIVNLFSIGNIPSCIKVSPDGNLVYVIGRRLGLSGQTVALGTAIDLRNNTISNLGYGLGTDPLGLEISPDGQKLFITDYTLQGGLYILDASSGVFPVISTIPISASPLARGSIFANLKCY